MQRARIIRRLAVTALLLSASGPGATEPAAAPAEGVSTAAPERGTLRRRVLLTGELAAARSTPIVVPRTRSWRVEIRWLIEDGIVVETGDRVMEFDNYALVARLEELRLQVVEAENTLLTTGFEARAEKAEKELEVERQRIGLEKARLAVSMPPELLSRLELEERRLAVARAESEQAKARDELAALRRTRQADLAIRRVELEKAARELELVEASLEALTLRAPVAGLVLVGDHPWAGRKLQVGDTVWVGYPVLTIPDLGSMEVRAGLADVDDGSIGPGMAARCHLDAYPGISYPCRVRAISPIARRASADSRRRFFEAFVDLERTDPQRVLLPGMSVRVEVAAEVLAGVSLVPRAAVDFSQSPARTLAAGGVAPGLPVGPCSAVECALFEAEETGIATRPDRAAAGDEVAKESG